MCLERKDSECSMVEHVILSVVLEFISAKPELSEHDYTYIW